MRAIDAEQVLLLRSGRGSQIFELVQAVLLHLGDARSASLALLGNDLGLVRIAELVATDDLGVDVEHVRHHDLLVDERTTVLLVAGQQLAGVVADERALRREQRVSVRVFFECKIFEIYVQTKV